MDLGPIAVQCDITPVPQRHQDVNTPLLAIPDTSETVGCHRRRNRFDHGRKIVSRQLAVIRNGVSSDEGRRYSQSDRSVAVSMLFIVEGRNGTSTSGIVDLINVDGRRVQVACEINILGDDSNDPMVVLSTNDVPVNADCYSDPACSQI